jgi:hypothetical protein
MHRRPCARQGPKFGVAMTLANLGPRLRGGDGLGGRDGLCGA